jgi:DNA helicase-2/ATP-dependent DNA helicase PcrA
MTDVAAYPPTPLAPSPTLEQRRIIEAPDGPVVVIAGAGTGKTSVIVERVRWLLETRGRRMPGTGAWIASEPEARHANPFAGPLVPEQLLVLTYNVKAAAELAERLDAAVGPTTRARMTVSNFHSFCQHVLTESAADAGLPSAPDVLDGPGQLLLLRDLRPALGLRYYGEFSYPALVDFINRAKDELVTPEDVARFADAERVEFERRYGGTFAEAEARLLAAGSLDPLRAVQKAYAGTRAAERAEAMGLPARRPRTDDPAKIADREARRTMAGDGTARPLAHFAAPDVPVILALAETYERDGAALEVLRLRELATAYAAYQAELARRNALDFGEQIALVAHLFKRRANVLRRWQRQYRYILVDEFQDANIAQIELIELLGRTPDRPDNVMVVGDDDQSIYRFRGASFAAFSEFRDRFAKAPVHAPGAAPPGPPPVLRLEHNFRSVERVLVLANRLIACNSSRFDPGKRLSTTREAGPPVTLHVCANEEDQAVAIVDAIRSVAGPSAGPSTRPWRDVAVLYRKHKHRDAIVERLRAEDIPYTVVGGLALFETAEIRDLEAALRAIANPEDDTALVRMLTAGPWRLDALEVLAVTRDANFDRSRVVASIERLVRTGEVMRDVLDAGAPAPDHAATRDREPGPVAPALRAKLRRVQAVLDELNPLTWRDGPHTLVERYLERAGTVLDLLSAGTLEARRAVVNIASFLRFAAEWQQASPQRSLADFIGYLDAYKAAGGELPTSVELADDAEGVRLMTLYQAKGLEFPVVVVPDLVDGEWPVREQGGGLFPRELLREQVPVGDLHLDEERRLLYVAMTRARERLVLATHDGDGTRRPSAFVDELRAGAGEELAVLDRTQRRGEDTGAPTRVGDEADLADREEVGDEADLATAIADARRVMALPTTRERRLALRLRAAELVGLLEGAAAGDPEADSARAAFTARLADVGRSAALGADQARAAGLDPLTFRDLALDSGTGASLFQVAPLPPRFSYSSLDTYERCPLQYAFAYVYRIPEPARPRAPLAFGSTAHEAFEAFTRDRRERLARGEPGPTREDLERMFRSRWRPQAFGDKETEAAFGRKVGNLLENFWAGEVATASDALAEEAEFTLVLDPGDGTPPVRIYGEIDRIDRLPSGGIEVVDYKTGSPQSQKSVHENLQLTIYALACRDALGLGTPERVTLYYTELGQRMSTTRTDDQLDAARAELVARARPIRAGAFHATPGAACRRCDYTAICPERA